MEQSDLLKYAAEVLEREGIPYALVGSFATGIWGESRFTQDIDIVIDLPAGKIAQLCAAFPQSDFYVSAAAAKEAVARRSQFNVIHPASGNKIDFMVAGGTAWSAAQLERRRRVRVFPEQEVDVAAPEDVILGKLIYYREGGSDKHLRDITGILTFSEGDIDRGYIARFAAQFGVTDVWQRVLDAIN